MSTNLTIGNFDRAAQVEIWRAKCRDGTMTQKGRIQTSHRGTSGRPQSHGQNHQRHRVGEPEQGGQTRPDFRDDLLSELDGL